ncbi:MAG: VOC family protein [Flavobacteriales bacterium]|nr:VOC family protein [Flavobacteriales bacterium]
MYTIHGIQHLGVGVANHENAWKWYRKFFGMNIPFFNAEAPAPLMDIYTDNETITKRAAMVMNLKGGCAMEIVCPTSFQSKRSKTEFQLGDYGIFIGMIKAPNVDQAYEFFKSNGGQLASKVNEMPNGWKTFYCYDADGNLWQVVPSNEWYMNYDHPTGGVCGCSVGVSDIDKAKTLYADILGYDQVVYDHSETFRDWKFVPGGDGKFRRVLLAQSKPSGGGFTKLSGTSYIELVQDLSERKPLKIYEGRKWGDVGFVHLGFDVRGMADLGKKLEEKGFGFTCDTNDVLSMGESTKVHCTYIEDPDGTLIELIEVYKIPIIEKLGINLNVEKRPANKPLPDIMLKALRFSRIKD